MEVEGGRAYRFGGFTLDVCEHRLMRGDDEVFLRPKSFETLLHLLKRHAHLVKKDELLDKLWPDVSVTESALTQCIMEVREALQDDPHQARYLKTIPRLGYKFIADVEEITAAPEEVKAGMMVKPSLAIAVLPFVNLSAEPENDCFCDGLAEELINGLSKINPLRVVAHSSSFSFKGKDVDVREIGRKLNVGSVVEGSVRRAGGRLRVAAQLINAADGYHVWSEQYDRELQDVFAIQDEISLAILDKLKVELLSEQKAELLRRHTDNLEAYHLYLKGRSFWHRRYEGFLQKSLECFQQAIEKDPLYAVAYAGLADAYTALGFWGFVAPMDVFPAARAMAAKALEIDDLLAEAYASRALVSMHFDWDWTAAEHGFKRAIELNPGSAAIRFFFASYLGIMGRFNEAIAEMKQAQALDPLSPLINANAGWTLYLAREHDAAIDELKRTIELDPHFGIAHLYIGFPYIQQERYEQALAAFQKAIEVTPGMRWAAEMIGYIYGLSSERGKAKKVLHDSAALMKKHRYVPSSAQALIYLGLGEVDKVFEWLHRAYDERDALMPWLKVIPEFDSVRSDPRFHDLLYRIGHQ